MTSKRTRRTKEEIEETIYFVMECLSETSNTTVIIQTIMEVLNVCKRTAFNNLKEARDYLAALESKDVSAKLGLIHHRSNRLYERSINGGTPKDIQNAINALRLSKETVMDHAKFKNLRSNSTSHDTTLAHNPLLARLRELEGGH